MKQLLYLLTVAVIIIYSCIHSELITAGCRSGILLWYESIIPVTLPFMIMTGIIAHSTSNMNLSRTQGYIMAILIGLLCGFPTGTIIISSLYNRDVLPQNASQILLPLCNNISPMFMVAYIYPNYLRSTLTLQLAIVLVYTPQILFTIVMFLLYRNSTVHTTATSELCASSSDSSSQIILQIAGNISTIGIYIVIFSIISNFISQYIHGTCGTLLSSFMEISQGVSTIFTATGIQTQIKTALILSLCSFGGLSALFQSRDLIKESRLSFTKYIFGKSICGIVCFLFSMAYITLYK